MALVHSAQSACWVRLCLILPISWFGVDPLQQIKAAKQRWRPWRSKPRSRSRTRSLSKRPALSASFLAIRNRLTFLENLLIDSAGTTPIPIKWSEIREKKRHININFLLWLTSRWPWDKRLVVPGLTGPKNVCVYKLFPLVNRRVVPGLSRLSKSLCVQSLCAFFFP